MTDAVYYRELPEYEQLEQLKNKPRVIRLPDWEEVERGTVNRKKLRRALEAALPCEAFRIHSAASPVGQRLSGPPYLLYCKRPSKQPLLSRVGIEALATKKTENLLE